MTFDRRDILKGGGLVAAGFIAGQPAWAREAPAIHGIADQFFGIDSETGDMVSFHGWTGEVTGQRPMPIEVVSVFASRIAGKLFATNATTASIVTAKAGPALAEPSVIDTGVMPYLLTVSPEGGMVVHADMQSGLLAARNFYGEGAETVFDDMAGVHDLRFSPLTGELFICSLDRADIRALDISSGRIRSVYVDRQTTTGIDHMSQTLAGRTGVVARPGSRKITILAFGFSGEVVETVDRELAAPPLRTFISASNRRGFVASAGVPHIDVLDLGNGSVIGTIAMPGLVTAILVDPLSPLMLAICPAERTVVAIDSRSARIVHTWRFMDRFGAVALNEESGMAAVTFSDLPAMAMLNLRQAGRSSRGERSVEVENPLWTLTSTNALAVCH